MTEASRDPGGDEAAAPGRPRRSRGRRIVAVVFLSFVAIWVVFSCSQIVQAVLFPPVPTPPWATCAEGQGALYDGLLRAAESAQGDQDPDEALRRFRSALDPEWSFLEGVRAACAPSEADRRSLDALERLRYAEEHAVRREASSLAALRRQVATALGRPARASDSPPPSTIPGASGAPAAPPHF